MNVCRVLQRSFLRRIAGRARSWTAAEEEACSSGDLLISDRCVERLKRVAEPGQFLRVLVDSGGCSGFEYKFSLEMKANGDDQTFEKDGVRVLVDALSLEYMRGATVDYQEEMIKSAFRVLNNPLAEKGCSCGVSFTVK